MYKFTHSGRTNIVMNIASEILVFTISWIKLLAKLAKFPTRPTVAGKRIGEERADRRRRRRRVWPCHYVREDKVEEGKG
jgi:hypothetical protein